MKNTLLTLGLLIGISLSAQQKIDTSFNFQTDPAKKLSIYLPSSYTSSNNGAIALALHPWNTNRWDAKSWRDTLVAFAEMNDLILICPDGGIDGQVDDAIDTAFTTHVMRLVDNWLSFDKERQYVLGFSWGGKTTYTYGLRNTSRFKGFLPIGAATDVNEVKTVSINSEGLPIYIVHGSRDNMAVRYTAVKSELESKKAIVNSNLLNGVNHTIDFPDRNNILTAGYKWIDSVNTNTADTTTKNPDFINESRLPDFATVFPNPVSTRNPIHISTGSPITGIKILDFTGREIESSFVNSNQQNIQIPMNHPAGNYFIQIATEEQVQKVRLIIIE